MRQLRIRELPPARDKLGNSFIMALIVLALFWGYQLRQVVDERDYLIKTIAFEASGEPEVERCPQREQPGLPACVPSWDRHQTSGAGDG
jgi:hypothetical protein